MSFVASSSRQLAAARAAPCLMRSRLAPVLPLEQGRRGFHGIGAAAGSRSPRWAAGSGLVAAATATASSSSASSCFGGSRTMTTSSTALAPIKEIYKDSSELTIWQDDCGSIVAEHDELRDIDGCKWALNRVCDFILSLFCQGDRSAEDLSGALMAARFLQDLGDRVERLDQEGYSTCAVELFERPWEVSCGDARRQPSTLMTAGVAAAAMWKTRPAFLRLRPRPDSIVRRAAFAVASPVLAPLGAFSTYMQSGRANSMAAFKFYFRAVTEVPCHVQLDQSYEIDGEAQNPEKLKKALESDTHQAPRRLVHGNVKQLCAA
eukprot:TRINITY_DN11681_c0_g1_i1.p1 TRINITY_DN11681_c0_g1~~TRINITY_DN11681_c0_g1_i1.p1  ORF type:complete len:320 (+),score=52.70 TRINITY_DN11681_c0_g1_i1:126-1085(+)